jgi:glutathione synthase/RimK-type ligase-like ATP-grasp enzyme
VATVAILTPDPADEGYRTRWRDVFERQAAPLRARRLEVEGLAWTADADFKAFDLVLPLLVWGYHRASRQWTETVTRWEGEGVRLQNPPSVLRWNADKTYLGRLAERGAPVVPTLYADRVTDEVLRRAAETLDTDRLIAKPQVSASAWQTIRWSPGRRLDGGPEGNAMIQPYLPQIESSGEISLIYFGGRFSHAISKLPQPGDFRVQPEYDGIITAHSPAADELEAAEAILATIDDEPLLYARVDLVRGLAGEPLLMELELVEPDLYFGYDAGKGAAFAAAVVRYGEERTTPDGRGGGSAPSGVAERPSGTDRGS